MTRNNGVVQVDSCDSSRVPLITSHGADTVKTSRFSTQSSSFFQSVISLLKLIFNVLVIPGFFLFFIFSAVLSLRPASYIFTQPSNHLPQTWLTKGKDGVYLSRSVQTDPWSAYVEGRSLRWRQKRATNCIGVYSIRQYSACISMEYTSCQEYHCMNPIL